MTWEEAQQLSVDREDWDRVWPSVSLTWDELK